MGKKTTFKYIGHFSLFFITVMMLSLVAGVAQAQVATSWGDVAFSGTLNSNELCYTDGSDIICDAGLLVNGAAALDVSGTVSATAFVGDGSGLTGVAAIMGINDLTDAKHDTDDYSSLFLGNGAGANDDGTDNANVGIGKNVLNANTTGYSNIALGNSALEANIDGYGNISIGFDALKSSTTGVRSTIIGNNSAMNTTTGGDNTIIGYNSFLSNETGIRNTIVGQYAGKGSTGLSDINRTVMLGFYSGQNVLTGADDNTFLGYKSGSNVSTGASNTLVGANAGDLIMTGSRNIIIGQQADTPGASTSDYLNIGDLIKGSMVSGSEQVSLTGTLSVATLCDETGANCNDLSAGLGGGGGAVSLTDLTDAKYDGFSLYVGEFSGANDDGTNTNTGIGKYALTSNTTGNNNTATGYFASYSNVSGGYNSAYGHGALRSNTASNNSAFGASALFGNPGADNAGFGAYALTSNQGADNAAFGSKSGMRNTTGFGNALLGKDSGYYNTTGHNNTSLGYRAQYGVNASSTGSYNVSLGHEANMLLTTGSNNIAIGASVTVADVAGDDQLNIGNLIKGSMSSGSEQVSLTGTLSVATLCDETGANCNDLSAGLGGASSINDLSDAKHDTDDYSSLFVGNSAGAVDDGTDNKNVGVGFEALKSVTSGSNNTALGYAALRGVVTGTSNVAVGMSALHSNNTGASNVSLGEYSQYGLISGSNNVSLGGWSLYRNTTGFSNIAIGRSALTELKGSNNVGIGHSALNGVLNNTTVNNNVALGHNAGYNVRTGGDSNTFLGYQAGMTTTTGASNILVGSGVYASAATASDELNIGNLIKGDLANKETTILGHVTVEPVGATDGFHVYDQGLDISMDFNVVNDAHSKISTSIGDLALMPFGNLGVGTEAPNAKLDVLGTVSATAFVGDGSGLTGVTATVGIDDLTDGKHDASASPSVFLGLNAGAVDDGTSNHNTGIGHLALNKVTSGYDNVAVGANALENHTTGFYNTAVGVRALQSVTTGLQNTAFGADALSSITTSSGSVAVGNGALNANTTGSGNTAVGRSVLNNNTTGFQNTGVGSNAMEFATGSNNSGFGMNALYNATGSNNTGVGSGALLNVTSGGSNTGIGYQSLYNTTTTSYNTSVGGYGLYYNKTGANNASVGYQAGWGASNASNYNNNVLFGYQAGYALRTGGDNNVMIGYQAGDATTTGASNILIGSNVDATTATASNQLNIGNTIYGDLANDYVGIGNTSPSVALDVTGDIEYTGIITDVSDRRLKQDIVTLPAGQLEKIASVNPVSFAMINNPSVTEYGVIAQELEEVFPILVKTADDASETKSVNYVGLIAPMMSAISELKALNEEQAVRLAKQESELQALKETVKSLSAK